MNIHQYQRYKRRSPIWIISAIILLLVILITMARKLEVNHSRINTVRINIIIDVEPKDSIAFPLMFLWNKEFFYYHASPDKRDTTIAINISNPANFIEILDRNKKILVSGNWNYQGERTIRLEIRMNPVNNKPKIIIDSH